MIKQTKYIILTFFQTVWFDLRSGYDSMAKPKEVLNTLFWLALILVLTERWGPLKYTLILYVLAYVWKIIKKGDWRRRMKE